MNFIKKIVKKFFDLFDLDIRRIPSKKDYKNYTTTLAIGSIVPCQIEAYFLALNNYVNNGEKVLDIGFGLGYGLNILAIKAKEVYGVEIDEKAYEYCCNTLVGRNPKLENLSLYNGYNIQYEDNFFDVVTCVDVIEHAEDYKRLIMEMLRISKKGVFISTPLKRPEYTRKDGKPMNYWHLREWSFEEFNGILTQIGKVDWNFLNGSFNGPFTQSKIIQDNTLTLSPFILKEYK